MADYPYACNRHSGPQSGGCRELGAEASRSAKHCKYSPGHVALRCCKLLNINSQNNISLKEIFLKPKPQPCKNSRISGATLIPTRATADSKGEIEIIDLFSIKIKRDQERLRKIIYLIFKSRKEFIPLIQFFFLKNTQLSL